MVQNPFFPSQLKSISVSISVAGAQVDAQQLKMQLQSESKTLHRYEGHWNNCTVEVEVRKKGKILYLSGCLTAEEPLDCDSVALSLLWQQEGADLSGYYVPEFGTTGMQTLAERTESRESSRFCGLFGGSHTPALLLGTVLPQNDRHMYRAQLVTQDTVQFTATTYYTKGRSMQKQLQTETTALFFGMAPVKALEAYAELTPSLPADKFAEPLVGWNTWDYYFNAVSQDDMAENLEEICRDEALRSRMKYMILDDGWECREGEWYANHRFPDGMAALAEKIRDKGLIPGIWTNGCQLNALSYPAWRMGDMILRDARGNAIMVDGMYVYDPTHPVGEAFLTDTYTRLYEAGYRVYKVDFVSSLLKAYTFHDPNCGPYEAIRRLFAIIRKCVGPESHIVGCSFPAECGAGYVDSSRIGYDIHNHWEHVKMVLDSLQLRWWENGRLFRIDPDFLVVRGKDTSKEKETNVFNPCPNPEHVKDSLVNRWRQGPVFDRYEAETWANIVVFAGGNLLLSDRLSMLNDEGKALLHSHLQPNPVTARPLDLGDGPYAGLWYSEDAEAHRLLVINHKDTAQTMVVDGANWGLKLSGNLTCTKEYTLKNGKLSVPLQAHESAVVTW